MSKRNQLGIIIVGVFLVSIWLVGRLSAPTARGEEVISSPEAGTNLPDLEISMMFYQLETANACLGPAGAGYMGVGMWIINIGTGDAGAFTVIANGASQHLTQGLKAGETIYLWFPIGSQVNVRVDADNRVAESNEDNNTREEQLPIPTLPMYCTSTPSPTTLDIDANDILTQAADRLLPSTPGITSSCKAKEAALSCVLAAGHTTSVVIAEIETPISPDDEHYHAFHHSPILMWEEASTIVPTGQERKIIWQIGGYEIRITSFDDTGIEVAFDPLLVAEVIYQLMMES